MAKRIVITGGHFTPGLALIQFLKARGWDIDWIGTDRAVSGERTQTLEAKVLPGLKVPFWTISTGKLARYSILQNISLFWKLPQGFIQSFILIVRLKPDVVLCLGSYVSLPVALSAWLMGVPIVIHEQTAASGLANRIVARFAKKVAISFEESKKDFPLDKCVLTGNLVRQSLFEVARSRMNKKVQKTPLLYITGGSRGSQVINTSVVGILKELLGRCRVVHQTGQLDYKSMRALKEKLDPAMRERYEVYSVLAPKAVDKIFEEADLAISRAGANTVSELAVCGIPSILIPIPWSSADEQTKNAQVLVKAGIAVLLPQQELDAKKLLETVDFVLANLNKMKARAPYAQKLVKPDAAEKLTRIITISRKP